MSTTVKTNNQPRELKCLFEFPAKQQQHIRSEFDWVEEDRKTEISATKAAIQAAERRLKSIEDTDHRASLMRKKYGE